MNSEFNLFKLGEVAEIFAGGDKPKIFSEDKSKLNSFPIYANAEKKDGLFGYTNTPRVVDSSVTVAARGSKVGFVALRKEPFFPIVRLLTLIPNRELLDVDYLFYNLKQNRPNGTGSAQPQITIPNISSRSISLPPLLVQQKTAKILSDLDAKIELNNKINAELEAMAKLMYDYWFVQFDFPNENGKPYKSSGGKMVYNEELKRDIPLRWEVLDFGDLVQQVNDNIEPNEYPMLPYLPIDKLPRQKLYYAEYESRNEANSSLLRFKEDDILLGAMRVYFHRVCNAIENGISRTTMMVLRPKDVLHKNYSLFTLNREEAIKYASKNSTGSSIPYAKWNKGLEKYKVCITDDKTLFEEFNKIVTPILNNFKILSKQNQKLAELRDWLLPMLMNGQVKVR